MNTLIKKKSTLLLSFLCVIFFISTCILSFKLYIKEKISNLNTNYIIDDKSLEKLYTTITDIQLYYHYKVDTKALVDNAIIGIMSSLDSHSGYIPSNNNHQLNQVISGKISGVGLQIRKINKTTLVNPLNNSPAEAAGVKQGDSLKFINALSTQNLTLDDISTSLQGSSGSKINLTFEKPNKIQYSVNLTRCEIPVYQINYHMMSNTLYINIPTFINDTSAKLKYIIESNNKAKAIILDLRDNPGGVLEEGINTAKLFRSYGEVIKIDSNAGLNTYDTTPISNDIFNNKPIVVLVNQYTASAAELVAGSLQNSQRAIIVGIKSYGKGSIQTLLPIGSGDVIKITTGEFKLPDNTPINHVGITPDFIIKNTNFSKDNQLNYAFNLITEYLKNENI